MSQSSQAQASDKSFAEQLLSAIGSVHSVVGITRISIERKPVPQDWSGQFDPYTRTATISPIAEFPLSTGVHEIGHAVDALFLVGAGTSGRLNHPITLYASQYAVQGRGLLVDWYQHVTQSRPIMELAQLMFSLGFMSDEWKDVEYLLDPTEIRARAYEQFIGEYTGDPELKAQFQQKRLNDVSVGDRKIKVYWTQDEFQSIEYEIKRVLESLGWM